MAQALLPLPPSLTPTPPPPPPHCSFAPWCGVCRQIGPEFARAAELAVARLPGVVFGAVDSVAQPDLADALDVTTFPRFFLYRRGVPESFPLVGTGEAFLAGVARVLGLPNAASFSPAKVFEEDGAGAEALASWLFWRGKEGTRLDTTLVLYAPPLASCGGAAAAAAAAEATSQGTCSNPAASDSATSASLALEASFEAAAGELLKDATLRFAVVRSSSAMAEFEVPLTAPSLVLYKDHDEGRSEYSGSPSSAEDIIAWVRTQNVPLVTLVTHKTLPRVRKDAATLALLFLQEPQTEHLPTLAANMGALREAVYALEAEGVVQRGRFTLGVTNGQKYASWMGLYQLPRGVLPALGGEVIAAPGAASTSPAYYVLQDAGGLWAKEALCGAAAVEQVGVKGKWRVVLSHVCDKEAVEAAIEKVRGELLEAGEEEEAAAVSSAVNDPARQFPEPLYVTAVAVPVEAVKAWVRKLVGKELPPVTLPGKGYAA